MQEGFCLLFCLKWVGKLQKKKLGLMNSRVIFSKKYEAYLLLNYHQNLLTQPIFLRGVWNAFLSPTLVHFVPFSQLIIFLLGCSYSAVLKGVNLWSGQWQTFLWVVWSERVRQFSFHQVNLNLVSLFIFCRGSLNLLYWNGNIL